MNIKVLTLFGEETIPYEPIPAKKPAAKVAAPKPVKEPKEVAKVPKPKKEKVQKKSVTDAPAIQEALSSDKQYFTIGEVAKMFKINTSHIRFWTNEFKLKVRTTRKGDRLYSPDLVKELKDIHDLVKGKGFTIAGAKAHLKNSKKAQTHSADIKDALQKVKNTLLQLRDQLA